MNNKAIILMSGGLDSLVALAYSLEKNLYDIKLALTFNYGQKSAVNEICASENICKHYNIEHKVIKLDWLKEITNSSIVSDKELPQSNFTTRESASAVWVPNRNALFLNISACFSDSLNYKYIIYGANKDEGKTFPDNTEKFRKSVTDMFKSSTLVKPIVTAPLINYAKDDIVKIGVNVSAPFDMLWSCYTAGRKHCGKCESCNHLRNALIANQCEKYLNELF